MDILHELHQLEHGGVERVVRNLAKYNPQHRHRVLAYQDGPMREELERAGAAITLYENHAKLEADVIHVHCGGAPSELAKACAGQGFAIVETIHSPVKSPNRPEWVHARVGVTQAVTNMNPFAVTILNGIDLVEMNPIRPAGWLRKELGNGLPVVGRIGRIGYDKGVEEFLVACHLAQRETRFNVVVAGVEATNAPGYLGKMLLAADSLPVEQFRYVGLQRSADFLQELDVFCYPSPTEGFGLVYAEAMAMEVPIVGWRTDAVFEVCGGHALLTPQTIPDLAQALVAAVKDEGLRKRLASGGRIDVEERFGAERMAGDYAALYERLVYPTGRTVADAGAEFPRNPEPLRARLATR